MKKYLSALAIGMALVTVVAPAAQADTAGCVSKREFGHVHNSMRMSRVHRLFDTAGHGRNLPGHWSVRTYKTCPRHRAGVVAITYHRGRVSGISTWLGG